MTAKDIEKLDTKIRERTERFRRALKEGGKDPDKALSALTGTEGWDIVRTALDKMIFELLEPETFEASAEAYAVSGESRRLAIQAIRSIIGAVEGASASQGVSE